MLEIELESPTSLDVDLQPQHTLEADMNRDIIRSSINLEGEAIDKGFLRYDKSNNAYETILPDTEVSDTSENIVQNKAIHNYVTSSIENVKQWVIEQGIEHEWINIDVNDWVADGDYYKKEIPFSTHRFLNAFVGEVKIINNDESEENVYFAYKLLANDTLVLRSDDRVKCKVLIQGDK